MLSGRGVSGHLPSERSVCLTDVECQGKCLLDDACHGICLPDEECQGICLLNAVRILQTQSVKADVVRMRSVRPFAFSTQRMSYRCRVSRQMSSRRGVSVHLPSERSVCLTDAECQGKCLPDNACHGICLPDEECQGIYLLDIVRVLQTQSVKADVIRMRGVRAFAF